MRLDRELACQEVVELVTSYLDDALSAEDRERFEEHLVFCDGCENYLEQMRMTIRLTGRADDELPTDLEAELRYARFLDELRPGTGVVWISCEAQYQHLSSSAIRELEAIQPGAGERYVPSATEIYAPI